MALEQSQNQNSRWRVAGVFLLKLGLVLILACAAAVAYLALRSHDPVYVLREFKGLDRLSAIRFVDRESGSRVRFGSPID